MTIQRFQFWHRSSGIIAAAFAIILAGTGLLLNHSQDLHLDSRYVDNGWLLDWYDIGPRSIPVAYRVSDHWISRIDSRIYFDDRELAVHAATLSGAFQSGDFILAATDNGLILLTHEGELVTVMSVIDGVPAGIIGIGTDGNSNPVIKTAAAMFVSAGDLEEWLPFVGGKADWSTPVALPVDLAESLLQSYRGQGLSLEKLILDFHTGRILGVFGVIAVDIIAVLFLLLSVSGSWLWIRRKKNR